MKKKYLLPFTFAAMASAVSHAATVSITTADGLGADTHIRNDIAAGPTNNYGAATAMLLGSNGGSPGQTINALMRFDLSALQSAAGGSAIVVNSVTLSFVTTTAGGSTGGLPFSIGLFDYGFSFVEGTQNGAGQTGASTYGDPAGGGADATAGGTKGTQLQTLSLTTIAGATTWTLATSSAFVADVQGAYAGTGTTTVNYLLSEIDTGTDWASDQTFIRINSGEATSGLIPTLTVDYTVLPEPSAVLLGGLGLLGLLRRRR